MFRSPLFFRHHGAVIGVKCTVSANDPITFLLDNAGGIHALGFRQADPAVGRRLLAEPSFHKQLPRHDDQYELDELWLRNCRRIETDALAAFRRMNWDEVLSLRDAGMEIGAHTANHVILGREGRVRRRSEITGSVARVQERVGIDSVPFSYPDGQAGDFSDTDQFAEAELSGIQTTI